MIFKHVTNQDYKLKDATQPIHPGQLQINHGYSLQQSQSCAQ